MIFTKAKTRPIKKIQREILQTLILLMTVMTALIAVISVLVNVYSDRNRLDQNLENIAAAVAASQAVQESVSGNVPDNSVLAAYLSSLEASFSNIDVISVIGADGIRKYHTNKELIGTVYDGTAPDFGKNGGSLYAAGDTGPSGPQRRAYAAIVGENGEYEGFVLAVMLKQNINRIVMYTVAVHAVSAAAVIMVAVILSKRLSEKIKKLLLGFEPDIFSAMFSVRDNILESLEEGILAVGADENIIYVNGAAKKMLGFSEEKSGKYVISGVSEELSLKSTLSEGEKYFGISLHPRGGADILADLMPVMEREKIAGALCILRDRTEYTKLMEDLSGVRFMVESMRANNHDFINKLHVILGLIQMGDTVKASEYITNITAIQQKVVNNIVKNIEDPSVAALLIGKYARASELNIKFALESGSRLFRSDIILPSADLVTIIGNLLDNAMDSVNEKASPPKELTVGIFTSPHAMIINVDDTGMGISEEDIDSIYKNGFSTKGENRGTGLYIVRSIVNKYNGTISAESERGTGTLFTVTLTDERSGLDV
ncbi:MAG: ATP-binding protein [Ruminococcus sp.]|nr:ATP-binding protein [Ruminococcus sp.]